MKKASDKLKISLRHLERVQTAAAENPTNWDDLSLYGFYCLETAVEAAALHSGLTTSKKHWEKAELATELHKQKKLPDVSDLLNDLNEARKAVAYGEHVLDEDLDSDDISLYLETYVDAVKKLMGL